MTLTRIFAEILAEFPRSIEKHPAAEWAALRPTQMLPEVEKEIDEIRDALLAHDMHGEHGVHAEIMDAIITLMRMRMELIRRDK